MIQKYRKRPIVVEAVEWTGKNYDEVKSFVGDSLIAEEYIGSIPFDLTIHTLEGDHIAHIGDMIIKGVHGEFYSCKPDIFKKTYDKCYTVDEYRKEFLIEEDNE